MNFKIPVYLMVGTVLLFLSIGLYNHFPVPAGVSEDTPQIAMESPERLERIKAMAETWPKEPRFEDGFNPLYPSANAKEEAQLAKAQADMSEVKLPIAENGAHELVAAYCSGCHSLNLVTQQHASPERWKQLLIWMEKKQGMQPLPKKDEREVLDYLARNF